MITSDTSSHHTARVLEITKVECAAGGHCGPIIRCIFQLHTHRTLYGGRISAKPGWIKTCRRLKLSELSAEPRYTQIYCVIVLPTLFCSMALYQSKRHSCINIILDILMGSRSCVSQIWLWISNKGNVL